MKNGFIIINYNDFQTTIKLLNNIKDYKVIDKIVVVDNASTDDSVSELKKYESEKITIIVNDSNKGYGSGINFGSKYLIEKLGQCRLIISNSDIVIYKEEDLIDLLRSFPDDAGIVGPIVKEHSGLNRGWKIPTPFQDSMLNLVGIQRLIKPRIMFYGDDYYKQKLIEVEAVSGCFFVIDSVSLVSANFFDEGVFLYYEENIMSRKMEGIHKKIYVNTQVEVFHNHSVSINKSINKIKKYTTLKRSQFYFQKEYNNAGMGSQLLLKFTAAFSYSILKFVYLFK